MKEEMIKGKRKGMGMLSMSDAMFMEADPTALEQAVMGEHFEMLAKLPLKQVQAIAKLLGGFGVKVESIKDIKHAVKQLEAREYNLYIDLVDSFDAEKEAYGKY